MRFVSVLLCSLLLCSCAASPQLEMASNQGVNASNNREQVIETYVRQIHDKILHNVYVPSDVSGNPETRLQVRLKSTGEVLHVRLLKSSGNPDYDDAVTRAIFKSSPLPLPSDSNLAKDFQKFILNFRLH